MIASAQTLRLYKPVEPFCERTKFNGMTYGLGPAGYDIRIAQDVTISPGSFILASSMEEFNMPNNLLGIVHDKSTWARQGLSVFNTVIEPGWKGFLTLELASQRDEGPCQEWRVYDLKIYAGTPIAQVIFHKLDHDTNGYEGKYQNQEAGPQEARFE